MLTNPQFIRIKGPDVAPFLHFSRDPHSHKGTYGHALLLAGSKGKTGAALLAAAACLRSGAGLLTVHLPSRGEFPLLVSLPEAMQSLDPDLDCLTVLPAIAPTVNAVAIGPGIGTDPRTATVVEALIDWLARQGTACRAVFDADALNILSARPQGLYRLPHNTILTPHPGELDRLAAALGYPSAAQVCGTDGKKMRIEKARLLQARRMATSLGVIVVLKGHHTATCTPCGKIRFNTTGNAGMATGGCGDVLTGLLLGLLAQRGALSCEPKQAAVTAVWAHGKAGDVAAARTSQAFLMAGDLIPDIPPIPDI